MKKITKKIYAIILTILMLLNYMPAIVKAAGTEPYMVIELISTATEYDAGDEILVDVIAKELYNTGAIKQFIANMDYDTTALVYTDIVKPDNTAYNASVSGKQIHVEINGAGTIGEGDRICTLKFTAVEPSNTETTLRLYELDTAANEFDCYWEDGNVNEPTITLPVAKLAVEHNLKITKTDSTGTAIQNNSALFKITDLEGNAIYKETEADGSLTLSNLAMPTGAGPFVYTIKEVVAPTGYVLDKQEQQLTVTFADDGTVTAATLGSTAATITADTNTIEISISNEAEPVKPTPEEFKLVLNKVDESGNSITTDTAEFTITKPDATKVNCATNVSTGKTNAINVTAPDKAGTYVYVVKETKAPTGYILQENNIIVELTYEEQNNKIVLVSGDIASYDNGAVTPTTVNGVKTLTLDIQNEAEVITYDYEINIEKSKNDTFNTNITTDEAIFEITNGTETAYVKTNSLGKATYKFSMTNKEIVAGNNYTYTIKEIKAPDGYILDETAKTITLTFNSDGSINTMNVSGTNITKVSSTTNTANVKIINEEEVPEVVLVPEDFNLVINKVDGQGNVITSDEAEFILVKPDGTSQNYTTTNGVISGIGLTAPETVEKQVYFLRETKAPEGYKMLNESLIIEMQYVENSGKIELANATIKDYNNQIITPVTQNGSKTLAINVKNNKIEKCAIEINIQDREGQAVTSGTTVLKITNKDTSEYFYKEVSVVNGKIELDMPTSAGTVNYEIEQIKAPEGYNANTNKINVQMVFANNSNNEIELQNYTVQGTDAQKGSTTEKNTASVIIINDKIPVEPTKQNYSLEIDKLDAETNSLITESPAVFTVIASNAKMQDYTTTNGKVVINGLVPGEAGEEVIYVIKEKEAPEGYKTLEKSIVIKVGFAEENGKIIASSTQVLLGTDIGTAQMVGTTVKVNVLNEKAEPEDLYVISKKDSDGIDIYNVMNSYVGAHYSIDNPFIDTKLAKYGPNCTVQEFINNLESNGVLTVWETNGNQVPNGSRVKTNMILKATKGEQELTFTIIVKGDYDGDGRVRAKDIAALVDHLTDNTKTITDSIQLKALDVNEDDGLGRVRANDISRFYDIVAKAQ